MKQPSIKPIRWLAVWGAVLALAGSLQAQQPAGLWNFDSGDLSATVGNPLVYAGSSAGTSFGTTTSFGIANIGGAPANVMRFDTRASGGGYRMPVTVAANGGGTLVNNYSVLMDVLFPTESGAVRRPLFETDLGQGATTEGAEFFINAAGGFSGLANVRGSITTNTWYRLGIVVEGSANQVRLYIDGVEQGSFAAGGVDNRFALNAAGSSDPFAELFKDLAGATALGYVNSVQFRGVALSPGQMLALGAADADGIDAVIPPVPPYFRSRTPGPNATGVRPDVTIAAVLDQGDRTITPGSVSLLLDGVQVAATIVETPPTFTISYPVPSLLSSESAHTIGVRYTDNVAGQQTVSWGFTVTKYQTLALPTPVSANHFQNFEGTAVGELPSGWSVTNNTTAQTAGLNLLEPRSDSYRNWVLIDKTVTDAWIGIDRPRRYNAPPIALNGALLPAIVDNKFIYAESDVRSGEQVQVLFTPSFSLTGVNNVFVAFQSMYEQNQDSMGALEYTIDNGATWLPVVYMINEGDIIRLPNGTIDAVTTLNTNRTDQAYDLSYGAFINAPITQALAPFISGRIDDNDVESKRYEVYRLPAADNQGSVRFRFTHTGTASWYWGIDNFGLYSINTPVITSQPVSLSVIPGDTVSFSVAATSTTPITSYQWIGPGGPLTNGNGVSGANSATVTITGVDTAQAGSYYAVVSNQDGPVSSNPATVTVIDAPRINRQPPLSVVASAGTDAAVEVAAVGRLPLSYTWYKGLPGAATVVAGQTSARLGLIAPVTGDAGTYFVVVANTTGSITSRVASVSIVSGAISQGLATHLRFDGNFNDASGANLNASGRGDPAFVAGKVGSGALHVVTDVSNAQNKIFRYATLGAPGALDFGTGVDYSVAFWVKVNSNSSDPALVSNKDWGSGSNSGWLIATDSDGRIQHNYAQRGVGRKDWDGPGGAINNGNWNHVAFTFRRDGSSVAYLNGTFASERPPSITPGGRIVTPTDPNPKDITNAPTIDVSTSTVLSPTAAQVTGGDTRTQVSLVTNIGQDGRGDYGAPLNALIDDVGIWRRALSSQEISAIYEAGLLGGDLQTAVVTPNLGRITASRSGNSLNMNWPAGNGVRLQRSGSLTSPNWENVSGTEGAGSHSAPIGTADEFFRLFRP